MPSDRRVRKPSRADVARRAGVSQTTVAYALAGTPGVKLRAETIDRVHLAAKELGYTPSFSARSMKRGRTDLIGILIPELRSQFHPYYSEMIHGICTAAADSEYQFLYMMRDRAEKYRRCLSRRYVDGVIVLQSEAGEAHLRDLLAFGLPVVSLNHVHRLAIPQVTADYEGAMEEAFKVLAAEGARKLWLVQGPWVNQPLKRYREKGERLSRSRDSGLTFKVRAFARDGVEDKFLEEVASVASAGLIVDGDDLARDICKRFESEGFVRPPMVVFSDAARPLALPEGVVVLSSRPTATGGAAWQVMEGLLGGVGMGRRVIRVPFARE